jgi:hypothetical protein
MLKDNKRCNKKSYIDDGHTLQWAKERGQRNNQ